MDNSTNLDTSTLEIDENTLCKNMFDSWKTGKKDINLAVYEGVARGEIPHPDPMDYDLVVYSEKARTGQLDIDNIQSYLEARLVVCDHGRYYRYNGMIYEQIAEDEVDAMIISAVKCYKRPDKILPIPSKAKLSDIKYAYAPLHSPSFVSPPPNVDMSQYDDARFLVPFLNGLYDIDNDVLLPYTPYIFLTYQLNVIYRPRVMEHPVEDIYRGIIPDERTRQFYYQMVGYTLFSPQMLAPAIFLIYGGGNTGKTALQDAVCRLLGDRHSSLTLQQMSAEFYLPQLEGKLVNFCGETGDRSAKETKADGELLKKLSEGQTVTVNQKYVKPYQFSNCAKLWFVSNTLPDFGDSSSGLKRRLYVMPCRQTQSWDAQIKLPMQEDMAESWFVNKCLDGFRRFVEQGFKFTVSDEMREEMSFYAEQDNIDDFISTVFETTDKTVIVQKIDGMYTSDLYGMYTEYVNATGGKPYGRRKFTERIRNEFNFEMRKVTTYDSVNHKSSQNQFSRKR